MWVDTPEGMFSFVRAITQQKEVNPQEGPTYIISDLDNPREAQKPRNGSM